MLQTIILFIIARLAEIGGGYLVWLSLCEGKPAVWSGWRNYSSGIWNNSHPAEVSEFWQGLCLENKRLIISFPSLTRKVFVAIITIFTFTLILSGCGQDVSQKTAAFTSPASASDAGTVLHPPSASTIATGTKAIAASFNLDELGVTNIVDANFVESKIGDPNWVIIDGRDKAAYEKGHIPAAVNFGKTIVTTLKKVKS